MKETNCPEKSLGAVIVGLLEKTKAISAIPQEMPNEFIQIRNARKKNALCELFWYGKL